MRRAVGVCALAALAACSGPPAGEHVETTATSTPPTSSTTWPDVAAAYDLARIPTTTRPSRSRSQPTPRPRAQAPTAPPRTAPPATSGSALASWYERGCCTASGERFNPDALTFAHRTMAFGTRVTFCHAGACVTARCNDRGPATWTGRTFDLSRAAFAAIAPLGAGEITVDWRLA